MGEKNLGGEAGDGDGAFLQELGALEEGGVDGHRIYRRRDESRRGTQESVRHEIYAASP
jgi:hypothetical protein